MNFSVRYRDVQTGALVTEDATGSSREEVVRIYRQQGKTVLSVEILKGRSVSTFSKKWNGRNLVLGGLVLGVVIIGGVFLFSSTPEQIVEEAPSGVHKRPTSVHQIPRTNTSSVVKKVIKPSPKHPIVQTTSVPSVEEVEKVNVVTNLPVTTNCVPHTFKTGTEQVISWIFTTRLGDIPPPLPRLSKGEMKNIVAILDSPNLIQEEDSDVIRDQKETVEIVKKTLKEYLAKGGDVEEFLSYYREQLVEANKTYKSTQKTIMQAVRTEDADTVKKMIQEANADLKQQGIRPLQIPQHIADQLGIESNLPIRNSKKEEARK